MKILVIDNDPHIRRAVPLALTAVGYRVRIAHDPLEARNTLADERPDLVVLDMSVTALDGADLAAGLRRRGFPQGVPIIVLVDGSQVGERIAQSGAATYLAKPFGTLALLAEVSRLLSPEISA